MHRENLEDELTGKIIGCAIELHCILGPGLLDSTYQQCLVRELAINNIGFSLEQPIPVDYKGLKLDCVYRIDILIEGDEDNRRKIMVELKSVEILKLINSAHSLSCMKLTNISTGLLINFDTKRLTDSNKRFKL